MNPIAFYVLATLSIAAALVVVLNKSAITSAFSLILVFFGFAGMFALQGAHLIATFQVLVYAGAIMVLFVFVIMLLNADGPSFDLGRTPWFLKLALGALTVGFGAFMVRAFRHLPAVANPKAFSADAIAVSGGNTRVLSEVLFSDFILPFELVSVLILSAIVGTIAIAMRKKKDGGSHVHAN